MSTPDFNKPDPQNGYSAPQQPSFNSYQQPSYAPAPAAKENNTLSIVGIVLSVFLPLIGIIVSGIAWNQATKEGRSINLARIGVFVGIGMMVLSIIANIVLFSAFGTVSTHTYYR